MNAADTGRRGAGVVVAGGGGGGVGVEWAPRIAPERPNVLLTERAAPATGRGGRCRRGHERHEHRCDPENRVLHLDLLIIAPANPGTPTA